MVTMSHWMLLARRQSLLRVVDVTIWNRNKTPLGPFTINGDPFDPRAESVRIAWIGAGQVKTGTLADRIARQIRNVSVTLIEGGKTETRMATVT